MYSTVVYSTVVYSTCLYHRTEGSGCSPGSARDPGPSHGGDAASESAAQGQDRAGDSGSHHSDDVSIGRGFL